MPSTFASLSYTVSDTATAGTDYTISAPEQAGVNWVRIPIIVKEDSMQNNDKTIILILNDGVDYDLYNSVPRHTVHTYMLTITDSPPVVSFAPVNYDTRKDFSDTMEEDVGVHNVKLYLWPMPTSDITVKYSAVS